MGEHQDQTGDQHGRQGRAPLRGADHCKGKSIQRVVTRRLASSAVRWPVAEVLMSRWKWRIAVRVSGPKMPSTGPL
jgi:hypothetical protein